MIADLKNDWSDTNNSNTAAFGTWSYREGNSLLPSVSNVNFGGSVNFPAPQPAWAPGTGAGDFLPAEFKAQSVFAGADFQVGDVIAHSTDGPNGGANGPANFLWTSPINGTVTISGGVWEAVLSDQLDNSWSLLKNVNLISYGASIDGYTRANPFNFSFGTGALAALTQTVSVGDTIDLQITKNGNLGYFVGANLTITAESVPEPGSMILLGLGSACCGAGAWRRRKRS
jgi:hypothetical protein